MTQRKEAALARVRHVFVDARSRNLCDTCDRWLGASVHVQLVPVAEIERLRRIEAAAEAFLALHGDFADECNGRCSPVAAFRAALEATEAGS